MAHNDRSDNPYEGHLKIEVEVTDNKVTDAWSSGTLFRGIETILKGRDPNDAWLFCTRVCGVCICSRKQCAALNMPLTLRFSKCQIVGIFSWDPSSCMII